MSALISKVRKSEGALLCWPKNMTITNLASLPPVDLDVFSKAKSRLENYKKRLRRVKISFYILSHGLSSRPKEVLGLKT